MLTYQAFIQSPGDTFLNLGFLTIRWYGLLISISVLIGILISKKLAKARNINPQYISDILPSLIISSVIGARTYYVIFEWRQYSGDNFFTSLESTSRVDAHLRPVYPYGTPPLFPSCSPIVPGIDCSLDGIAIFPPHPRAHLLVPLSFSSPAALAGE